MPWKRLLLALLTVMMGCSEPERLELFDRPLNIDAPVALRKHVAFLNRSLEEVFLICAEQEELAFDHIPVGREPVSLVATPDLNRLAVLSRRDKTLTLIDMVEPPEHRVYQLESAFDAISFSPDSNYAIVYYDPNINRPSDVLFNPDEYAVIDFTQSAAGPIASRALRGLGATPSQVHYVPPFELSDEGGLERYAMFIFDSYVTFADLRDPSFEVTVFLDLSGTPQAIIPREVLFTQSEKLPALQDSFVYILAHNQDSIYVIQLLPSSAQGTKVRLAPRVGILDSGKEPSDIDTFVGPDGREKLLSVNAQSRTLTLNDAAGEYAVYVPLENAGNRILIYDAMNATTGSVEPHAMVYSEHTGSDKVAFVRLSELEQRKGQAISNLAVGAAVDRVLPSPIDGQVVISYQAGAGLALLDLEKQAYSPLSAKLSMTDLEVDHGGLRLFASLSGSNKLNIVNLSNARPRALPLDFPITQLVFLPQSQSLIALHDSNLGLLTALAIDAADSTLPQRARARMYSGFFLNQLTELGQ
ncbi:MAG: hypothetical protein RBU37_06530 [Myxococcota bacterium]|jgi:hypothetical protein|nr:hypothetical protein [Myxococcota bacterium]